jgi:hypothetical protein
MLPLWFSALCRVGEDLSARSSDLPDTLSRRLICCVRETEPYLHGIGSRPPPAVGKGRLRVKKRNDNGTVDESSDQSFPASDPPSWAASPPASQRAGYPRQSIQRLTARLPSDFFVWTGVAVAAASIGLLVAGKKQSSALVGGWVPTILAFGLYSKMVRMTGLAEYLH